MLVCSSHRFRKESLTPNTQNTVLQSRSMSSPPVSGTTKAVDVADTRFGANDLGSASEAASSGFVTTSVGAAVDGTVAVSVVVVLVTVTVAVLVTVAVSVAVLVEVVVAVSVAVLVAVDVAVLVAVLVAVVVVVLVGAASIVRVPVPFAKSFFEASAWTVNVVDPAGDALVVVIVNVTVLEVSLFPKETGLGENEYVTPSGRAVVIVKGAVNGPPPLPLAIVIV